MTVKKRAKHSIEIKTFRNKHLDDVPTLINAVEFFLDELLKRCTIDHKLSIKVTLKGGPLKDKEDDASIIDGLAWEREDADGGRLFHIQLNGNTPFLELLSTLAHETVHVVQFALGRLRNEDGEWFWDGSSYGLEPYTGDEDVDNQLPWEYDAYSKEVELARKFIKQYYSIW